MAKRKTPKVSETDEFEVTVKDDAAGSQTPQSTTQVKATDPDSAIDAATRNDPKVRGADEITVKKTDPTAPAQTQMESVKVTIKPIVESVQFPYTVYLPKSFKSFLNEHKLAPFDHGGGVMVRFENKTRLTEALRKLNRDGSATAGVILRGIEGSI